jgi:putative membrane protein
MRPSWSATIAWAGVFSVAVGLGIASAQSSSPKRDGQPSPSTTTDTADHDFVSHAAMSNMAEIQLGHMAAKKTQHTNVKRFAQTMIDDHVKAQQRLADAAYGAGIRWPTKLDEKHRQIQQRLSKLSDDQFDREYMKAMVDGHRDVEKMLAARVSKGEAQPDQVALSAKVNQWAAQTLPDVRAHLKEAEQVYGELAKGE